MGFAARRLEMDDTVRAIEYFYATVGDKPGEARRLLEHLSEGGVNLVAFTAFPVGGGHAQLDFVPESVSQLRKAADDANVTLVGPKKAFLIQGDDRIGALHQYHLKLANAGINVRASNGACGGTGSFGFVLWVSPEDFDAAAKVLDAQPT
jgi:hypothetical protein